MSIIVGLNLIAALGCLVYALHLYYIKNKKIDSIFWAIITVVNIALAIFNKLP